jgi:hypothetical protein
MSQLAAVPARSRAPAGLAGLVISIVIGERRVRAVEKAGL